MKLEVGMYVRYNGQIMKITELGYNNETFMSNGNGWFSSYNCNASHNIIDLIEVGDYVNGEKVVEKWEEPFGEFGGQTFIRLDGEVYVPTYRPIETIVTREQFESVAYKVVEE